MIRTWPTVSLRSTDELFEALDAGTTVIDAERVDVLAHGLQCAAILERVEPTDVELQIAGLVHDLGTVLAPGHPESHAAAGADAVGGLLGGRVAGLVRHHDDAKRFLVTTDPRYRHRLSERSLETLRLQGGLLDPEERAALLGYADLDACLTLRRADDMAKTPGVHVPGLAHWRTVLEALGRSAA
jgi:predicted HD phosphohydrolase